MTRKLRLSGLVFVASALCLAGCTGVSGFLNPEFLQVLGVGQTVAYLPGEAPAIVVEVENGVDRVIEYQISWRDPQGVVQRETGTLGPGKKMGEVLFCPIEEVTLGDVSNLDGTGAIVRLGEGGSNDPIIEVEPFGVLLQEGINYDCGDSITFTVLSSSATLSGYQAFAFIRRSGAQTEMQAP